MAIKFPARIAKTPPASASVTGRPSINTEMTIATIGDINVKYDERAGPIRATTAK